MSDWTRCSGSFRTDLLVSMRFWNDFLFQLIDVRQFALLRIGLGSLIIFYLIGFIPFFEDQFSPIGWLGPIRDLNLYHAGNWSLLFLCKSQAVAWSVLGISLLGAIFFTLGLFTRISGFLTLIGLISLWNRNPLIMDGDDAVLRVMLFYLLLSPSGNAYSIDDRLRPGKQQAEIWPLRMIRAQLALIYFISGWVKFHSPEWLDGTVLQFVLIHPEYSRWNFHSLMTDSLMLQALRATTFIVMGWEILFPILILIPVVRSIALATGLLFHSGLLVFMHLRLFSVIMLVLYIAWITPCFFRSRIRERV